MTLPKAVPALPPRNLNASDVQGSAECGMMYKFVCLTRRAEVEALCVCERDRAGGLLLITHALRGEAGAHSWANRHRKGVRALQRGAEVISHPGLPAHAPYALALNKNTHVLPQDPPLIRI